MDIIIIKYDVGLCFKIMNVIFFPNVDFEINIEHKDITSLRYKSIAKSK